MKKFGLVLSVFLLLAAAIVCPAKSTEAQTVKDSGKVYMVVIDTLSVSEINKQDTPNLWELTQKGAIGVSSNRTLRGQNNLDTSLTIGAGNLARAYREGIMGYNSDEKVEYRNQTAAQLYKNLTGNNPDNSSCLLVNLPEIAVGLETEDVTTVPGCMGQVLKDNQRKVCVLGNGDNNGIASRISVAIGMDASGQVPLGDVGSKTFRNSPSGYLGCETDYNYLINQVKHYQDSTDVIIIELSDLARLEESDVAFPEIAAQQRKTYLKQIDSFAGQLGLIVDAHKDLMLVISPSPSLEQISIKNTFTPVIAYGKNVSHGFITSGATRRDYIISNTDIAPTVLNFFNIEPASAMIGQSIQAQPAQGTDTLKTVQDLSASTATVTRLRAPLVKGYILLLIIIILLSVIAIFWVPRLIKTSEPLTVGLVAVPLVLLPLGKLRLGADWQYMVLAVAAIIVVTVLAIRLCKNDFFKSFIVIAGITALMIDLDLITGNTMIQSSVLGYDPMAGARYYGIGNEYMGMLLGSIIILGAVAYEKFPRKWMLVLVSLVFLIHCYLIGSPSLGAQSDGVLTAPVAFLVTIALLGDIKINPRILLGIAGIVIASILGLTIYDMNRPAELQTHIGRSANQIAAGGWKTGFTIILRKLGMNAKLIRYTIWSRVFIVMLAVLALLVYRPVGAMRRIMAERPRIVKGFAGIVTAAIVGLIVNDSGIVAAATTSIYMVIPLLMLMMALQKKAAE